MGLSARADDRALGALAVANDYSAALHALEPDRLGLSNGPLQRLEEHWEHDCPGGERLLLSNEAGVGIATHPSSAPVHISCQTGGATTVQVVLGRGPWKRPRHGTRFKDGNEFVAGTARSVSSQALGPNYLGCIAREVRNPDPQSRIIPARSVL